MQTRSGSTPRLSIFHWASTHSSNAFRGIAWIFESPTPQFGRRLFNPPLSTRSVLHVRNRLQKQSFNHRHHAAAHILQPASKLSKQWSNDDRSFFCRIAGVLFKSVSSTESSATLTIRSLSSIAPSSSFSHNYRSFTLTLESSKNHIKQLFLVRV
ncbi:hypothetical protein BLNAU_24027 [Blattamonas nauphoetae]|uniref:Uncharacterized protein n=1 Tax=Blattamonas nauphoetae TaxID=2049346 RepID=A0ABQ9WNK7_9EUKA|nr:hypothetical protein BLNAU_24027 [Blattamonas nauphoetae]